ncbi:DUF1284 domain-containing protein [Aureimonas fodinaquatilis]|uniref:DUF1284 domain-containing protein n=1 Tax=Aureimonas fodinaquatilis TaxID=2565783 RepID=A0A5B0DUV3_9HYPH|nr:DUF1284 domain-containing protein [Aureimonas fodinaquatilis]KAA0968979.1 DUF1284 domain-containing protein [Aureimonas fodinaquatilis]
MTLRLRPHHLLCMLNYVGLGYNDAFVANYDQVIARVNAGEDIEIVAGPDDICAPLLKEGREAHCLTQGVKIRDAAAARDIAALVGLPTEEGSLLIVTLDMAQQLRGSFATKLRRACHGCEWSALCSTIAGRDFTGAHLHSKVIQNTV